MIPRSLARLRWLSRVKSEVAVARFIGPERGHGIVARELPRSSRPAKLVNGLASRVTAPGYCPFAGKQGYYQVLCEIVAPV